MLFAIPITSPHEIAPLFRLIEVIAREDLNEERLSGFKLIDELRLLVSDCGISHSTLEEVFMKVTNKKEQKLIWGDKTSSDGSNSSLDRQRSQRRKNSSGLTEDNVSRIGKN